MNKYQKEKEALRNLITQLEDCMAEGRGKIIDKDAKEAYQDNKILRDACKVGLNLIERATPMKPKFEFWGEYGDITVFHCPICNHDFGTSDDEKYCPDCGQRVDLGLSLMWGDSKHDSV